MKTPTEDNVPNQNAFQYLCWLNPGTHEINGQEVVMITKNAYKTLLLILGGRKIDYE